MPRQPLSVDDIIALAYMAGFRGNDLVIAVAVALGESGGRPDAVGDVKLMDGTWGPSVGLWQIRSLNKETAAGKGSLRDQNANLDPWVNAQHAYELYRRRGGKFQDWTVYTKGMYRKHVGAVQQAVQRQGGESGLGQRLANQGERDTVLSRVESKAAPGSVGLSELISGAPGQQVSAGPGPIIPGAQPAPAPARPVQPQTGAISGGDVLAPAPVAGGGGGGGGGGGVQVAAATAKPPAGIAPPGLTGPALDQWIRDNLASDAWMLNHPELGPIVRRHAKGEINDAQYAAALQNTHYYRTTNDNARAFDVLRNTNPQQAEQQVRDRAGEIERSSAQMGVTLSEGQARSIAERSLTLGWGTEEVNDALAALWNPDTALQGNAATISTQIAVLSRSYGIDVPDATVNGWVRGLLDGTVTLDTVSSYFQDQAKTLYPWMAAQIDAGMTPLEYAGPYIATTAKLLELNPADVDLDNPFVKQALQRVNPQDGLPSPMGLWDFQQHLRRSPEYDRTMGALGEAAGFAEMLGRAFGKVA